MRAGASRVVATVAWAAVSLGACTADPDSPAAPTGSAARSGSASASASTSASASASKAAPTLTPAQYRDLLVAPADVPITGLELTTATTGAASASVAGEFATPDQQTLVTDVISVFDAASDATIALAAARDVGPEQLTNPQERALTGGGRAFAGTGDGRAVTIAIFIAARAFVTLQFRSPLTQPVAAEVVNATVEVQRDRIEDALPR